MTAKRNNRGFTLVLVVLALVLVGSAVVVLSQMCSDVLYDAKQAQRRVIRRNETISQRALDNQRNQR